jgi:hypothetical protein
MTTLMVPVFVFWALAGLGTHVAAVYNRASLLDVAINAINLVLNLATLWPCVEAFRYATTSQQVPAPFAIWTIVHLALLSDHKLVYTDAVSY